MNKVFPAYPVRRSPFEEFLMRKDEVVSYAMRFLDAPDLITISKVNLHLRHWYSRYGRTAWDFNTFARQFVRSPRNLFNICDPKHTLLYGEAVFRFMNRGNWRRCALDICTDLENIDAITHFLSQENYFCPTLDLESDRERGRDRVADLVRRTYRVDSMTWYYKGDKGSSSNDLEGYIFQFTKGRGRTSRTINVYLVRCEPHRHVLSRALSKKPSPMEDIRPALTYCVHLSPVHLFHEWEPSYLRLR